MPPRARRALAAAGIGLVAALLALTAVGSAAGPLSQESLRLPRRTLDVDGVTLAFHQIGAGPDVVLLHGGMGTAEDFEPLLAGLAQDHRLTVVDRPGFGASACPSPDAKVSGNARLLTGLLRGLGLNRPVVVGHSHGGAVALRLAADAPELVSGLVLIAPAAYPGHGPGALDRLLAVPALGEGLAATAGRLAAPAMIRGILEHALGPDRERAGDAFITDRIGWWTQALSLATHGRQQVSDGDELAALAARYAQLATPAVVLWCDGDPWEQDGTLQSHRLAGELPHAQEVALADCGHYVQLGRPEAITAAVRTLEQPPAD